MTKNHTDKATNQSKTLKDDYKVITGCFANRKSILKHIRKSTSMSKSKSKKKVKEIKGGRRFAQLDDYGKREATGDTGLDEQPRYKVKLVVVPGGTGPALVDDIILNKKAAIDPFGLGSYTDADERQDRVKYASLAYQYFGAEYRARAGMTRGFVGTDVKEQLERGLGIIN